MVVSWSPGCRSGLDLSVVVVAVVVVVVVGIMVIRVVTVGAVGIVLALGTTRARR